MAILKFLLVTALLAILPKPICSTQSKRQIRIPALRRIAQLGYLYDEKTDNVIDVTVFRRQIPAEHLIETQSPSKSTVAAILNSIEKQFKLFSIDDSAAVNLLTGITAARGAAGILNEGNRKSQPSGILLYKYETMVQSLETCHDGLKDLYNDKILGHIEATHVVTSITWGATVAVTLDGTSIDTNRDTRHVQNSFKKELQSLRGKPTPSDEVESNFSMSITSDILLFSNENPTTAKEVKEILNQVPTLIAGINQGKGIPLQYTLTPLNFIRKHMGVNIQNTTAHKLDDFTLSEIIDAFQVLRSAEDRINEIKNQIDSHPNCVPSQATATINTVFSNFQNFKKKFTTSLKTSVIKVRSGLEDNSNLSDLLEQFSQSDFTEENLNVKFEHLLSSAIGLKIEFCSAIQNEFSQLEYIGAGDDLLIKLTTFQKAEKTIYIMLTNSELIRNQPEKYTKTFSLLLKKLGEETNKGLFVDCDLCNSTFCSHLNDTGIFKYANGTFSPSVWKRAVEEKSEILELKEIIGDIQRNLLYTQNFTTDQHKKILDLKSDLSNVQNDMTKQHQQILDLKSDLSNVQNLTTKQHQQILDLKSDLCNVQNVTTKQHQQILDLKSDLSNVQNLTTKQHQQILDLKSDLCNVQNVTTKQHQQILDLKSDLSNVQNLTTKQHQQILDLKSDLSNVQNLTTKQHQQILDLKSDLCNVQNVTTKQHQQILDLKSDLCNVQNVTTKQHQQILDLKSDLSNVQNLTTDQHQKILDLARYFSNMQNATNERLGVLEQKLVCGLNPCLNSGKCLFENNDRTCECSAGFLGDNCETDVDDCADNASCLNGGTCLDAANSYACACAQGFTGNHCEVNIDDCAGHSRCMNGGNCVDGASTYTCGCAQGFTGYHCETNIDDCAGHSRCLNGGTCTDGVNSFSCVCLEKFIGNHCEHINECLYHGTCASVSIDDKCECRKDYVKDPQDRRKCILENENATLIFGSVGSIEQFSLKQSTVTRIQDQISVFTALDFMYRTNTMFWSGGSAMINTAPIRQGASKTVIWNDAGSSILSLAVDWVYGHLYFADDSKDTINVANLDGSMKKVLFNTEVTHTRAIVVDPLSGWIYWTDFTAQRIERAGMDGSGREVIANTSPNWSLGLAIDLIQNRLYWTTWSHPRSIYSMKPHGSDKKLIFQAAPPQFTSSNFFSITTFGDDVYWRDVTTKAVYKTNKCGGGEAIAIHSVTESSDSYRTLQAYHFSKQPEGVNYCANRIGGQCSHLCFPTPSAENVSVTTKCACPDGRTLSSDQKTCT